MNAANKGYGYMDDFIVGLEDFIAALQAARDEAAPLVEEALERWVTSVESSAKTNLNRPHWLLQENISHKVKAYQRNKKIWAMVGFRFKEKQNKRDPGYYGQFHEAGWAPDRQVTVPHHFLRRAKKQHQAQLEKEIQAATANVMEMVARFMQTRRIANRKPGSRR